MKKPEVSGLLFLSLRAPRGRGNLIKKLFMRLLRARRALAMTQVLVALVAFPLSADNVRRAGQTSGALLRLGGNARAYGLGEAYGAIDDFRPSAFYYNPAAASFNRQIAFDMLHGPLVTPIFYDSLAGVVPIGTGAIGIGLQYLSYGKFEEIDNTGALTGDSFSPNEMLGRIVYGTPFHGTPLKLGIGVKYLASKLYTDALTLAGDAGVLYATPYGNLGVSYQNFGKGLKFIKDSSPLPAQMRASAAIPIPFYPDNLITLGTVVPRYGETSYQAGLEFHIKATREFSFYPRAGYNSATAKSKLGSNAGYSAGMGFEFLNFALDYAYVPLGEIGDTHRVSLSYRLGARIRSEEPEKGKQETSAEGGSASGGRIQKQETKQEEEFSEEKKEPAPAPKPKSKPKVKTDVKPKALPEKESSSEDDDW